MAHCPECGATVGEAAICTQCGRGLSASGPGIALDPSRTQQLGSPMVRPVRTIVGVEMPDPPPEVAAPQAAAPTMPSRANRTIVGMPALALPGAMTGAPNRSGAPTATSRTMVGMPALRDLDQAPENEGPTASSPGSRTLLGGVAPFAPPHGGNALPEAEPAGMHSQNATMIGVARPGIAPIHPGVARDDPAFRGDLSDEIGATRGIDLDDERFRSPAQRRQRVDLGLPATPPAKRAARTKPPKAVPSRAIAVIVAGGVLAVTGVLFGLFWHGAPPITALARLDAQGKEVLEVRCPSCPDGTTIGVAAGTAIVAAQVAQVPLAAPLTVGENLLTVSIDRPSSGRDEQVKVNVHVAYRIRPDLATLQGDRPAIQVVVEASPGTTVTLDGKPVSLVNGSSVETIDVTDACTGLSDEQTTLTRKIPYAVTTQEGTENGTVNVAVGILPLHLDAPGPHAITDGKSFVLAGRTLKGAEIFAAGRSIPVTAGAFAQVMNVSSVGATQIEVRAKMTGLAPRLTQIAVKRVDSLESAAADFSKQTLVPYSALSANIAAEVGKPIVLAGEVGEVRRQNHQTILLLDVSAKSGCTAPAGSDACRVRLVQGGDNPAKGGDLLTAYGSVAQRFSAAGKDIPEIQVDFTLKGIR